MTRYGASLAGTSLATAMNAIVGGNVNGSNAPGEHTAALVAAPTGRGYWLVGCDGSVYHFAGAAHLAGARAAVAGHHGVAAAVATPDAKGLWLVTADGTIVPIGDATPMTFDARPARGVTGAKGTPDGRGIVATTSSGVVLTAGTARSFGDLGSRHLTGSVVGIAAMPDGNGYWLVENDGSLFAFGDAHSYGSAHGASVDTAAGRIVGLAATPDGRGYWEVAADGSIFAFGNARFLGTGRYVTPPYPQSVLRATPGPSIDVVAAPAAAQGYWIVGDTGRVTNRGAAVGDGGDNNLAMLTP
jgi:ribosomal protein L24E